MGTVHRRRRRGASEHDRGYKLLFSDPTLVEELLRGFLPGTWIGRLDFTTLEEIIRKEKLKPGDRLPAVLPLVLYNGDRRWRAPLRLESLFVPVPHPLRRYLPRLTYHLLDERRLDLSRPELEENPIAALFRIETAEDVQALPSLSQALDDLLPPGDAALRRTVHTWFTSVVRRRFPDAIILEETNRKEASMLDEVLDKYFEIARQEGRQEGVREGRQKGQLDGMRKAVLQVMTSRFGRLPKAVRSRVEQMTSARELERLTRKVLRVKTLQEMGLG